MFSDIIYPLKAVFCYNNCIMEIWKDIKWYEWKYQISNLGRVNSLDFSRSWIERILKLEIHKNIYCSIVLWKNNIRKNFYIHRLVAQAFLWLNVSNKKLCVCHRKEDLINWLLDNSTSNLWIWTHRENMNDMVKKWRCANTWKWKYWKYHNKSKEIYQYDTDLNFIKKWYWWKQIERGLWISQSSICNCYNWKRKTAGGFIWKLKSPECIISKKERLKQLKHKLDFHRMWSEHGWHLSYITVRALEKKIKSLTE